MSIVNTRLAEVLPADAKLDRFEFRPHQFGFVNAVRHMEESPNSIKTESMQQTAQNSWGTNLRVQVMDRIAPGVNSTRSCSVSMFENTSGKYVVSWNTASVDITMVRAQYQANYYTYGEDLLRKLFLTKQAIMESIDTAIYTEIEANALNEVYNSDLIGAGTGKFPLFGGDIIEVFKDPLPNPDRWRQFFGSMKAINLADNITDDIVVIGSTEMTNDVESYNANGQYNADNTAYVTQGKTFFFANNIIKDISSAGNPYLSQGYFMPNGSIALLTRNTIDAQNNSRSTDGTVWSLESFEDFPYELDLKYSSTCKDASDADMIANDLSDYQATQVEQWQFGLDYAVIIPYNLDESAFPSMVRKFGMLYN